MRPESATNANIALEGVPLRWTGKLIPKSKALRMFMFKKSYQVQHVNGLTYDFLFDMAKKLADAGAMMLITAGSSKDVCRATAMRSSCASPIWN